MKYSTLEQVGGSFSARTFPTARSRIHLQIDACLCRIKQWPGGNVMRINYCYESDLYVCDKVEGFHEEVR